MSIEFISIAFWALIRTGAETYCTIQLKMSYILRSTYSYFTPAMRHPAYVNALIHTVMYR